MKMRVLSTYIFAIFSCLLLSCSEQTNTSSNNTDKDSIKEGNIEELRIVDVENMIDASKYLSDEELNLFKKLLIRKYRKQDLEILNNAFYGDDFGFELNDNNVDFINKKVAEYNIKLENKDDYCQEFNLIYKLLTKLYPDFKSISKSLYEERLRDVYGIVESRKFDCDSIAEVFSDSSFIIYAYPSKEHHYTLEIDPNEDMSTFTSLHLNDFGFPANYMAFFHQKNFVLPFSVILILLDNSYIDLIHYNNDYNWEILQNRKYKSPDEMFAVRNLIYDKCLSEGKVFFSKSAIEYTYHYNNYVFYENKASLNWLINHEYDIVNEMLFSFNYDKDSTINKICLKRIRTECFDKDGFIGHYYNVINGVDLYGNEVYHENMLQFIVDNCYNPDDKDEFGLVNCDLVLYLLEYSYFPESDNEFLKYEENGVNWRSKVMLAYYQLKAFDVYVEKSGAAPRCWVNVFAQSLYSTKNDCESLFYKKIKEENFYGYDLAERCQDLYDEYRGKFKGDSPD